MKTTRSGCACTLEPKRIGKHRYCLSCHAATMRIYRARKKAEADLMRAELEEFRKRLAA